MMPKRGDPPTANTGAQAWAHLSTIILSPFAMLYGAGLGLRVFHPPRRRHHRRPDQVGLCAEDLRVAAPGGGTVSAWLVRGRTDRVAVVGHGIGLSRSASLWHAAFLHTAGYSVCLFDHRNHGTSSGTRAMWNLSRHFTDDITALVRHLRGQPEYATAQIAVFGFSFSTFPALYSLTRADCAIDAVICDSGPTLDLPPLLHNFVDADGVPLPAAMRRAPARPLFERAFVSVATTVLGGDWPPPDNGRFRDTPILLLAGEEDRIAQPDLVARLAGRYARAQLQVLPGVGHLNGLKRLGSGYERRILNFLDQAWTK